MTSRAVINLLLTPLLALFIMPVWASYELETVVEDLNFPWSVTFLPDGDYLVATRPGEILRVSPSGNKSAPLSGTPEAFVNLQGGYFDIMLDNNFATNQTVYLSFAWGEFKNNATRIVKAKLGADGFEGSEVLFTVSPTKLAGGHFGGRMAQLADDSIVLTTGDGFDYREASQDTFSQLGKVIRLNADGSVPADNPFANGKNGNPYIWSFGHRNPQGLLVDTATNAIYSHEHGPKGGDELNHVEAGKNYGWPAITYGVNYSGAIISPFQEAEGMEQPLKYWVPSIAPSGFALYQGEAFPAWQGDFFIGALVNKEVRRIEMDGGKVVGEEALFSELNARIRDVRVGLDGFIYLLTDEANGKLIRVKPSLK